VVFNFVMRDGRLSARHETAQRAVESTRMLVRFVVLVAGIAASSGALGASPPTVKLWEWEKGIAVESVARPGMTAYLWFYEWNMFDARLPGVHTNGTYHLERTVSCEGTTATIVGPDMQLDLRAGTGSVDLSLRIANHSKHDWPLLASIIPCFNPGAPPSRTARYPVAKLNVQLANRRTYFVAKEGLERLVDREIHFNTALRDEIDRLAPDGRFVFSSKWPTSNVNAHHGLLVRDSTDGKWVAGIAWENFLSAQGHNPWQCMHLAVRVGPLKQGQTKTVRGKIYLFPGNREDCLDRFQTDFPRRTSSANSSEGALKEASN